MARYKITPVGRRAKATVSIPRTRRRASRPFRAGRDRVGGFYGRFANGGELKFHDIDVDDAVVSAAGTIQNTGSINLIPQNTTEITRIGRKCTIRKIQWRYQINLPEVVDAATPGGGDTCRVILYKDKQCNGATATVTGILESADYHSFYNLGNSGRFTIYMDRYHTLNYRTLTAAQNADTFEHSNVFLQGRFSKSVTCPLEFDSTAGALTEIRSNNLGVLLISSTGVCAFNSSFRLRFSDS